MELALSRKLVRCDSHCGRNHEKVKNNRHITISWKTTENTLMRLVFHDCMRYQDGTGGCDGCINFKVIWGIFVVVLVFTVIQGVGHAGPSPHNKDDYYKTKPINETDNNGMDQVILIKINQWDDNNNFQITMKLELIYTTVDWPFKNASMNASLFQLGKHSLLLWNFPTFQASHIWCFWIEL